MCEICVIGCKSNAFFRHFHPRLTLIRGFAYFRLIFLAFFGGVFCQNFIFNTTFRAKKRAKSCIRKKIGVILHFHIATVPFRDAKFQTQ